MTKVSFRIIPLTIIPLTILELPAVNVDSAVGFLPPHNGHCLLAGFVARHHHVQWLAGNVAKMKHAGVVPDALAAHLRPLRRHPVIASRRRDRDLFTTSTAAATPNASVTVYCPFPQWAKTGISVPYRWISLADRYQPEGNALQLNMRSSPAND